jgi:hypothetical protein
VERDAGAEQETGHPHERCSRLLGEHHGKMAMLATAAGRRHGASVGEKLTLEEPQGCVAWFADDRRERFMWKREFGRCSHGAEET